MARRLNSSRVGTNLCRTRSAPNAAASPAHDRRAQRFSGKP